MARGEGGGGHYDERRRTDRKGFADDESVLSLIRKPRAAPKKPVVVVKKKRPMVVPRAKPSRVQVESHSGEVPEMYTPQDELARRARPASVPFKLRSGAAAAEERMRYIPSPEKRTLSDFVESLRSRPRTTVTESTGTPSFGGPLPGFSDLDNTAPLASRKEARIRSKQDVIRRKRLRIGNLGL